MKITAVVPAFNADWCIERAISGLLAAGFKAIDIVVADDASTDRTPDIATALGVRLLRLETNAGAANARNAGAALADGDVILFVDADVVVLPDVRTRLLASLGSSPDLDAVFGLYDDKPHCPGVVGRFRNLLHHFVHLHGPDQPHSFWTGCGAVRRSVFADLGGFDARLRMMEDVEFGMRLTSAGGQVLLDRQMRARHLKCWSLRSMIRMDILDRAIPWSRLLLFRHTLVNELNLDQRHRVSAIFVLLVAACLGLAMLDPRWLLVSGAAFLVFVLLNWSFHMLAFKRLGWFAGLISIPLHLLHTLCAIIGFGWVFVTEFIPSVVLNRTIGLDSVFSEPLDYRHPTDRRP